MGGSSAFCWGGGVLPRIFLMDSGGGQEVGQGGGRNVNSMYRSLTFVQPYLYFIAAPLAEVKRKI